VAVIIQKYGGTSVGSIERIEAIAEYIVQTRREGHQVVVVLSAMAGETNRLLALAHCIDEQPASRELDMLLATGEQVSISLLAMALIKRGISAISLLAHQINIATDNHFGKARIQKVHTERLLQALEQEQVAIVAGFQGQDAEQNITTLGRGGSDTSAVAIAAALGAAECQIFTDVDGIYSADPRIVPDAKKIEVISFQEMLLMASLGAKVLHNRSVEYAMKHQLPIRVMSSFSKSSGTLVSTLQQIDEQQILLKPVTGICSNKHEALIFLKGCKLEIANEVIEALAEAQVEIDMVTRTFANKSTNLVDLTFAINHSDYLLTMKIVDLITINELNIEKSGLNNVSKVSIVGSGLQRNVNIEQQMSDCLAIENIDIYLISSSDINISVIIKDTDLVRAVCVLHKLFMQNQSA
jgi:aspartate kinase